MADTRTCGDCAGLIQDGERSRYFCRDRTIRNLIQVGEIVWRARHQRVNSATPNGDPCPFFTPKE